MRILVALCPVAWPAQQDPAGNAIYSAARSGRVVVQFQIARVIECLVAPLAFRPFLPDQVPAHFRARPARAVGFLHFLLHPKERRGHVTAVSPDWGFRRESDPSEQACCIARKLFHQPMRTFPDVNAHLGTLQRFRRYRRCRATGERVQTMPPSLDEARIIRSWKATGFCVG